MNNWFICLPREDLDHCIKVGVFGLKRKNVISQVKVDDRIACLVTREKEWKVIAFGEATSDYYLDDSRVFKQEGAFIDRFKFKATKIKPEISFLPLTSKLAFITKPEYYPVYFKNGIVKISDDDWQVVTDAAQQK